MPLAYALRGPARPGHRRRRHDRFARRRPAPRGRCARGRVLDNFVRGRLENLAGAGDAAGAAWSTATSTTRPVRDRIAGKRPRLPSRGHPHHPVRGGAAAALESLVDGTFTVLEAAVEANVAGRSSPPRRPRCTAWRSSSRPPSGTTRTTTTPSTAPRRRSTRACCAASTRCTGLDYVALRYFNVYGPRMDIHGLYTEVLIRWMERIDRRGPADLRRRSPDHGLRAPRHRPGQRARGAADVTDAVYNIASGTETSLLPLAEALLRVMDSDLPVEHGPERAVNGVTPPRRHLGSGARPRVHRRARAAGGPAGTWWTGGAQLGVAADARLTERRPSLAEQQ